MRYINSLRNAIDELIREKNAYILGEDIMDPYGGAFRVTKGLSTKYPDQVIATPMCEQGFTALSVGMALMGDYVIEEIMFGDFITLAADQMVNHAAKFYGLYGQDLHLVLRTPSGGYRGYGATHSQSLEKMFLGIPGLAVIAANAYMDPGELLKKSIGTGKPTLFIENKLDYPRELILSDFDIFTREETDGNIRIGIQDETPEWTIVTYGGMSVLAVEAAKKLLYDEEITADVLIVTDLNSGKCPADIVRTAKNLIVEEGAERFGWGSQVASDMMLCGYRAWQLGAADSFIPSAKTAEREALVQADDIVDFIKGVENS